MKSKTNIKHKQTWGEIGEGIKRYSPPVTK